ncbi:MAG: nucleotidyltransferase domain-containing protein [Candidatus Margulisiibacteriota bacterium]|jgi:predicted nucleotidyltransferase
MISSNQINQIVNIIKKTIDPKEVFLFGSYASGMSNENSDLDIAIIKNNVNDKHKELFKIRKALFKNWVPMDLLLMDENEYNTRKSIYGTVQYEIAHKGKKIA